MRTTTADGVEIHHDVTGSGPPVVFVHGITDSGADWAPVVERLAPRRTCVTLDLRGHGASGDATDYSPLAMVADVAAVVAATGVPRPLVVGHSLGAVVVSAHAAGAPTRGVVNIDQSLRFSEFAAGLRQLEPLLRGEGFHDALAMVFAALDGPLVPDELRSALARHREQARPEVVLGVWDMTFSTPDDDLDAVTAGVGAAITVPYLALHGSDPGADYPAWLTERVPTATVEVWSDHGHYPHLVDPDRFVARLLEADAAAR